MGEITKLTFKELMSRLYQRGLSKESISPDDIATIESISADSLLGLRNNRVQNNSLFHILASFYPDVFQAIADRLGNTRLWVLREVTDSHAWNVFHVLASLHPNTFKAVIAKLNDAQRWSLRELKTYEHNNVFHLLADRHPGAFKVFVEPLSDAKLLALREFKNKDGWNVFHFLASAPKEIALSVFVRLLDNQLWDLREFKNENGWNVFHLLAVYSCFVCDVLSRLSDEQLWDLMGFLNSDGENIFHMLAARVDVTFFQIVVGCLSSERFWALREIRTGDGENVFDLLDRIHPLEAHTLLLNSVLRFPEGKYVSDSDYEFLVQNKQRFQRLYEVISKGKKAVVLNAFSDHKSLLFKVLSSSGGGEVYEFFCEEEKKAQLVELNQAPSSAEAKASAGGLFAQEDSLKDNAAGVTVEPEVGFESLKVVESKVGTF